MAGWLTDGGKAPSQFIPIISIDHLSRHYQESPVDDILAIVDQRLLVNSKFIPEGMGKTDLSQDITQPTLLGTLVNNLYLTLEGLKRMPSCEVLLYLSGHGTNPQSISALPRDAKPHPDCRRTSIYEKSQQYLQDFYDAYSREYPDPPGQRGFVGGEVHCHQWGYIGVLGVLGLWCYVHCGAVNVRHCLFIVADCCYSGVWGTTLSRIMGNRAECLREYRELLQLYPVLIQCATQDNELSYGGVFTPLVFLEWPKCG